MAARIYISGPIGYPPDDWYEEAGTTLANVRQQVESQAPYDSVTVFLNSPGGDVAEGLAIYDYLRSLGVMVKTVNEARAWSIASVIFLAGTERHMAENASIVIHNPFAWVSGESGDMAKAAELLSAMERQIAGIYAAAGSLSEDEFLAMMKDETIIDTAKALDIGLATQMYTTLKAVAWFRNTPEMSKKNSLLASLRDELSRYLGKNEAAADAADPEPVQEETPEKSLEEKLAEALKRIEEIENAKAEAEEEAKAEAEKAKELHDKLSQVAQQLEELENEPAAATPPTAPAPEGRGGKRTTGRPTIPPEMLKQFAVWEKKITG